LWRKDGWLDQELSKVRLRANDVLVLQGDEDDLARVAADPAFLMMVPFHGEARMRRRAWLAGLIMLGTILLAAFNLMSIEMAALAGAVAVVFTRCLGIRQAYESIEERIITQFMSDAATTALFAPVAVALAQGLGRPPEPFVVTVAMAAVVAFLTPIGHHGNLLVYGPGRYRFGDFVRVGTPLTVLAAVVVVFLAPLLWRG
jgi:di/tricarboxylate transporter